ncbi:hypothetical protein AB0N16_34440 [Streptomyces sp. NPDC051105]|uniref:hypothetical protein n=1 Tax=Streptomyces sp. NPDC051105 TaxID=3154843 RepID=UPI00341BB6E1
MIVGPSVAGQPNSSYAWWTTYLNYVKANNVGPDIYSWHDDPGDPVTDVGRANSTISAAGLTNTRPNPPVCAVRVPARVVGARRVRPVEAAYRPVGSGG